MPGVPGGPGGCARGRVRWGGGLGCLCPQGHGPPSGPPAQVLGAAGCCRATRDSDGIAGGRRLCNRAGAQGPVEDMAIRHRSGPATGRRHGPDHRPSRRAGSGPRVVACTAGWVGECHEGHAGVSAGPCRPGWCDSRRRRGHHRHHPDGGVAGARTSPSRRRRHPRPHVQRNARAESATIGRVRSRALEGPDDEGGALGTSIPSAESCSNRVGPALFRVIEGRLQWRFEFTVST